MRATRLIRAFMALALVLATLAAAPAVSAHTHIHVGDFELSIGWANEPTFVGVPNGVEVTIADHDGEPVTDLEAGDITVIVSIAGESTEALPLEPAFVVDVFGEPGQYVADLLPTVPGDYTFQFAGTLHEETVDVTVTSGDETFSPVNASSDIEFPVKVPTLAEVATHLERTDGRIEELQADAGVADHANVNATNALDAANRAAMVGSVVGGVGVVVAVIALFVAWRASRRGAGSA